MRANTIRDMYKKTMEHVKQTYNRPDFTINDFGEVSVEQVKPFYFLVISDNEVVISNLYNSRLFHRQISRLVTDEHKLREIIALMDVFLQQSLYWAPVKFNLQSKLAGKYCPAISSTCIIESCACYNKDLDACVTQFVTTTIVRQSNDNVEIIGD